VVIAHDHDDATIHARAIAIGAEMVVTPPDRARLIARAIRAGIRTAA
jgi:hypothetical protein